MEEQKLEFTVPVTVVSALGMSGARLAGEVRKRAAASLYSEGLLSLGKSAELAGISCVEFLEYLGRSGIPLNYSAEDLEADLAAVESKIP